MCSSSDCFSAWRVSVIFSRDVRVVAGILVILLGTFLSGIGVLIFDTFIVIRGPVPELLFRKNGLVLAVVSLAMAFNWVVTGLIVSKLWWADKHLQNASVLSYYDGAAVIPITRTYQKVIIVLIESGTLFSVFWLIGLIPYTMGEVRSATIPVCFFSS